MKGILKYQEPLASYTSWNVGGPADIYYRPYDLFDLSLFLANIPQEQPITWLGLGSNVLISDQGIKGVVIHMLPQQSELGIHIEPEIGTLIRAEAGVTCAKIAKYCAKLGMSGAELFAGIPGTMGGALAMNAGAWGGETWHWLKKVEVINRAGHRQLRCPSEYQVTYRSVKLKKDPFLEEWFTVGYFRFLPGNVVNATARIKSLLQERNIKQPIGVHSCGSVFKNPDNDYAGRLIESSNLKGYKIGDAEISTKHANFILNRGNASATDIYQLIKYIQKIVFEKQGVQLETEVRMLGEME